MLLEKSSKNSTFTKKQSLIDRLIKQINYPLSFNQGDFYYFKINPLKKKKKMFGLRKKYVIINNTKNELINWYWIREDLIMFLVWKN